MLKKFIYIIIAFFLSFSFLSAAFLEKEQKNINQAQISIYKINNHFYIHEYFKTFVASYILEDENTITIIDTLFSEEEGKNLLAYARSLNKEIDKIIITHSHSDHIGGLNIFKDYPIYALKGTIKDIKNEIEGDFNFREIKPKTDLDLSGNMYKTYNMKKAHIADHLVLFNDNFNHMITGDLVVGSFNNAGLIILDFKAYPKALKYIEKLTNKETTLFTSHTGEASQNVIKDNLLYLQRATDILNRVNTPEEYLTELHKFYPAVRTDKIQLMRLKGNKRFQK